MTNTSSTPRGGSNGSGDALGRRLRRWLVPKKPPKPLNPAVRKHERERAEEPQNRVADWITMFAGSMAFVYIHLLWFACWIGFGVEDYPFGLLTMIVSLEAIFLLTFVLISQNRGDARRQVIADQAWQTVQEEDRQNRELIDLSRQILRLTKEVRLLRGHGRGGPRPEQRAARAVPPDAGAHQKAEPVRSGRHFRAGPGRPA